MPVHETWSGIIWHAFSIHTKQLQKAGFLAYIAIAKILKVLSYEAFNQLCPGYGGPDEHICRHGTSEHTIG